MNHNAIPRVVAYNLAALMNSTILGYLVARGGTLSQGMALWIIYFTLGYNIQGKLYLCKKHTDANRLLLN